MNIEDMTRTMPYKEEEGYVAGIVARTTERAINTPGKVQRSIPFARIAASIAVMVTLGGSGWMYMKHKETQEAPLDTFLSSISDEEAEMLDYYYIEEIELD